MADPTRRSSETEAEDAARAQREEARLLQGSLDGFRAGQYPRRHLEALRASLEAPGRAGPWGMTLSTPDAAAKRETAWEALCRPDGAVLLLGDRGTGKTQLAVELGWRLARERRLDPPAGGRPTHLYRVFQELLADEKRSWKSGSARDGDEPASQPSSIRSAGGVGLLVLDEIQERSESAWEDQQLTWIFDHRYNALLRTVLVANLTPESAKGRLPASVWSRLTEVGTIVVCDWPSLRRPR